jgi:hypothetical protein
MSGWIERGWVVMGGVFELKGPTPVIGKTGRSNAILGAVVLQGACLAVTETFSLANSIAVATDLEARRLLWAPSVVASVASDNSETMLPCVGLKMSLQVVNRRVLGTLVVLGMLVDTTTVDCSPRNDKYHTRLVHFLTMVFLKST